MNKEEMKKLKEMIIAEGENANKRKEETLQHDVEWLISEISNLKVDENHDVRMVASMLISRLTGSLVPAIIREYGELIASDNYVGMMRILRDAGDEE